MLALGSTRYNGRLKGPPSRLSRTSKPAASSMRIAWADNSATPKPVATVCFSASVLASVIAGCSLTPRSANHCSVTARVPEPASCINTS